jgi:hypothetical protein
VSLLLASSAAWLTGCSPSDEVVASVGPKVGIASAQGQSSPQIPRSSQPDAQTNALIVTPRQRAYLDTLSAAGVTPSSDLSALSIGSYVCQARAAKQTDQAVWDFVAPLVRNDVADTDNHDGAPAVAPSEVELRSATSEYIRVAIERLC